MIKRRLHTASVREEIKDPGQAERDRRNAAVNAGQAALGLYATPHTRQAAEVALAVYTDLLHQTDLRSEDLHGRFPDDPGYRAECVTFPDKETE